MTESYSKLMSPEMRPLQFTGVSPCTVNIDEVGIQNTSLFGCVTMVQSLANAKDLIDKANNNTEH